MRFRSRILTVAVSLATGLGIAGSASALSLADLVVPGASFSAGNGALFGGFAVKLKGKGLSRDLSDYEVVPTAEGFALVGDFSEKSSGGKVKLTYVVAGTDLVGAGLAVGVDEEAKGQLKVKEKIFDDKAIGKLRVSSKSGETSDDAVFGGLAALEAKSKIRIQGDHFLGGSGASIDYSVQSTVPEPSTVLMLAAGLAGLAATGRRRCGRRTSP